MTGRERLLRTKQNILRLVEYDTLNRNIITLHDITTDDLVVFIEPWEFLSSAKHHKKKVTLILSAMRSFAQELIDDNINVLYFKLHPVAEKNRSFTSNCLNKIKESYEFKQVEYVKPIDYHWRKELKGYLLSLNSQLVEHDNNLFLTQQKEFNKWASGRKELVMEYFYREVRKKYNILLEKNKPIGGKWNFDHENRAKAPKSLESIQPFKSVTSNTTKEVMQLVDLLFPHHFGETDNFHFACNKVQAQEALHYFITNHLPNFGQYQDIMMVDNPWLYHSHLSFYLNIGLLTPLECVDAAVKAYQQGCVPLNSTEGFIRQVIGWREYIKGIYHLKMPEYEQLNALNATRNLPSFFWDFKTKMKCLEQSVRQTFDLAYAHHIQRLMVIGNFALIAGLDPKEVNEWFLIVYADAYPWVHLPNVSGMSLFADGGILATKPYASSGSYINKMSNYCKHCYYNVKDKSGPQACPFNYLYWNFLIENREKFESNHRMRMIYSTLDKMSIEKKQQITIDSEAFLSKC